MSNKLPLDKYYQSQVPRVTETQTIEEISQPTGKLVTLLPTGRGRNIRTLLLLLVVISLASLGSVPLTPGYLAKAPPTPTPVPTAPPTPTPILPGGECTATSAKYLAKPEGSAEPPTSWGITQRTKEEYALVQACAATFVIAYHTFDAKDLKTLEASVSMLSTPAQKRFYGPEIHGEPNQRMKDELWRAGIQRAQLSQVAQAARPDLIKIEQVKERLIAWMVVPYEISIKRNGQTNVQSGNFTVLLVERAPRGNGTGWQVSDWREGKEQFAQPDPL